MARYFITLTYKGTNYCGWQRQPHAPSVQQTLEEAIQTVFRQSVSLTAAGRTDTGVHAQFMTAHFDWAEPIDPLVWVSRLNAYLPSDISLFDICPVQAEAHARFDALSRTYHYFIHTHKNPFLNDRSWYCSHPLQLAPMQQAADLLLTHDDFQCFSKVNTDVTHFKCNVMAATWQQNDEQLVFEITANRFLRNMVRAIVGTLYEVGRGKLTPEQFQDILVSKNRSEAGFSAPAQGLFLTQIEYPYPIFNPQISVVL
ncbi:MAG: tRNA pseudouridine(38-40) synthase TruA [Flavobacterium sp. BFFFF2]|nr:MAG: tRNA pseudouridine(38-40) synthase TruA [Flavobacterium sp. BFFFF2]